MFSVVTNNSKVSVVILSRNHSIRLVIIQIIVVLVVVILILLLLLLLGLLVAVLVVVTVVVVIVVLFTAGVLYVQHLTLDVATRRNTNIV